VAIAIHYDLSWCQKSTNVSDSWTIHTSSLGVNQHLVFYLGSAYQVLVVDVKLLSYRTVATAQDGTVAIESQEPWVEGPFALELVA
jgi:hypothetical protein